ncbi:MAG TPA: hypothetical protein VKQ09_00035 [Sphingomonas sp.]|nr:hypothetical protein [Sphingomonas sp.]
MKNAPPTSPDFLDEDVDDELMFDEADALDAALPSAPKAKAPKARHARPAEGTGSEEQAVDKSNAIEPVPAASATAPIAVAEEPVGAPVTFPPPDMAPTGSKPQPWLLAIVGLSLFSSLLSVGGLITVSRTLAQANAARQEASTERDALAHTPELIARLDGASQRLDTAAARLSSASPSGPPATVADIRHEIDALKLSLAEHQPDGVTSLNGTTRDGFSEVSTKLDRLTDRLDKMAAAGGAVSASRPASPAAYPKRPS